MNRRDLLISGGFLAMTGGAFALKPRGRLALLPEGSSMDKLIPQKIGSWVHVPSEAMILPKSPGSLADRLYSQTVARLYLSESELPVMMVVAYGAVQNDLLQLHRPEVCYAAFGFSISDSHRSQVVLNSGASLPVRDLVARSDDRTECITYWTRIGDDLPADGSEQRLMRLKQQLNGYVADGVLVRLSTVAEPSPAVYASMAHFVQQWLKQIPPVDRPVLLGRPLAKNFA